jgi:hypothetical protein
MYTSKDIAQVHIRVAALENTTVGQQMRHKISGTLNGWAGIKKENSIRLAKKRDKVGNCQIEN